MIQYMPTQVTSALVFMVDPNNVENNMPDKILFTIRYIK